MLQQSQDMAKSQHGSQMSVVPSQKKPVEMTKACVNVGLATSQSLSLLQGPIANSGRSTTSNHVNVQQDAMGALFAGATFNNCIFHLHIHK